jgi:hypothetical protein
MQIQQHISHVARRLSVPWAGAGKPYGKLEESLSSTTMRMSRGMDDWK